MKAFRAREDSSRNELPSHPFSPELCQRLSYLPRGLDKVALDGKLTHRCILLFERISRWEEFGDSKEADNSVAMCVSTLQKLPKSCDEILAIIGTMVYFIHMQGIERWYFVNGYMQIFCKALMKRWFDECGPGLMVWTAMILKTVYGPENHSCDFSGLLIACAKRYQPGHVRVLSRFFWDESLTTRLNVLRIGCVSVAIRRFVCFSCTRNSRRPQLYKGFSWTRDEAQLDRGQ